MVFLIRSSYSSILMHDIWLVSLGLHSCSSHDLADKRILSPESKILNLLGINEMVLKLKILMHIQVWISPFLSIGLSESPRILWNHLWIPLIGKGEVDWDAEESSMKIIQSTWKSKFSSIFGPNHNAPLPSLIQLNARWLELPITVYPGNILNCEWFQKLA